MFTVCYQIITPESAREGEVAEQGIIGERLRLREAATLCGFPCGWADASEYPAGGARWVSNYEYGHDYRTGAHETRSLHIPDSVTRSSRRRILRALGVRL